MLYNEILVTKGNWSEKNTRMTTLITILGSLFNCQIRIRIIQEYVSRYLLYRGELKVARFRNVLLIFYQNIRLKLLYTFQYYILFNTGN